MSPKLATLWLAVAMASAPLGALAVDLAGGADPVTGSATDRTAEAEIAKAIASDPRLSRADVSVAVREGVARLTGHVATPALRGHVAEIARRTDGVHAVDDELTTAPR